LELSKSSLLKLCILLLLTVRIASFLTDNFSHITIEKIINSSPDEMDIEVESETAFFQKITKNNSFSFNKNFTVKIPVLKNIFLNKNHLIEYTTPPPEFIF
jgi:hypothetical protein